MEVGQVESHAHLSDGTGTPQKLMSRPVRAEQSVHRQHRIAAVKQKKMGYAWWSCWCCTYKRIVRTAASNPNHFGLA